MNGLMRTICALQNDIQALEQSVSVMEKDELEKDDSEAAVTPLHFTPEELKPIQGSLTSCQKILFKHLLRQGVLTLDDVVTLLDTNETTARQHISLLRKRLRTHNIQLVVRRGRGWHLALISQEKPHDEQ
jgi:hypothetical protein